jgi:hypothetical protein
MVSGHGELVEPRTTNGIEVRGAEYVQIRIEGDFPAILTTLWTGHENK